jgi:hypothetical protein
LNELADGILLAKLLVVFVGFCKLVELAELALLDKVDVVAGFVALFEPIDGIPPDKLNVVADFGALLEPIDGILLDKPVDKPNVLLDVSSLGLSADLSTIVSAVASVVKGCDFEAELFVLSDGFGSSLDKPVVDIGLSPANCDAACDC